MKQDIREEFEKKFGEKIKYVNYCLSEGDEMIDIQEIVDFFLSHHNTTLKEIEEEVENVELNLESGNKDHENFAKGVNYMKEKVKQLIDQKLIK